LRWGDVPALGKCSCTGEMLLRWGDGVVVNSRHTGETSRHTGETSRHTSETSRHTSEGWYPKKGSAIADPFFVSTLCRINRSTAHFYSAHRPLLSAKMPH
jgi:hypothetical protein